MYFRNYFQSAVVSRMENFLKAHLINILGSGQEMQCTGSSVLNNPLITNTVPQVSVSLFYK